MIIDIINQLLFQPRAMANHENIQIEFAVQIKDQQCVKKIQSALDGLSKVQIDMEKGSVLVDTDIPWVEVQRRIEATGRRAVLSGFGGKSAVSIVDHGNAASNVRGVVRFSAASDKAKGCVVDGVIDGLEGNGTYYLNIHECGDISNGCASVGTVYDSNDITSDENGRATIRLVNERLNINDIIGRSVVVTEPHGDTRLTCGIIARSAGIFENYKKICACDGVTLWDERDRPLAGKNRSEKAAL